MFLITPNQCQLFFRDPEGTFTSGPMTQVLADQGVTVEGEAERFALQRDGGPTLYASVVRGEVAAILARRLMGRGCRHRAFAESCDTHTEIRFDNLDEVLDEINPWIDVQVGLQQATGGLLYRSWNRSFSGPDE